MARYREQPPDLTESGNICRKQVTTPFYLVIDTDIFLRHLTFVVNLLSKIDDGKKYDDDVLF